MQPFNILEVNFSDIYGNRFNGRDLTIYYNRIGFPTSHAVWNKYTDDPEEQTWKIFNSFKRDQLLHEINRLESFLSWQSILQFFPISFLWNSKFLRADVVHYHLINSGYFSMLLLPLLTKLKPSIWTMHDPWALTGHCIYPYDCDRWKSGCDPCMYLSTHFPLREDKAAKLWKLKKFCYQHADLDLVVASKFMENMVRQSEFFRGKRIHHIRFGVDLELFRPRDKAMCRKRFEIPEENIVISFRSTNYEFKGLKFIKECLHRLQPDRKITLITFNETGLLTEFYDRYQVIDLGWVTDDDLLVDAYNTADLFLMPSVQEAFGMMAMEAMACGKPVITFDGTSLPEIIFAPEGGISVPQGDVDALFSAMSEVIGNAGLREKLGDNALQLARKYYDFRDHAANLLALYDECIQRKHGTAKPRI